MHLQLAWVLQMVSSHSKAANVTDRVAHGDSMQRQYQLYEELLQQAKPPLYELAEAGIGHAALDGHATTDHPGETDAAHGLTFIYHASCQIQLLMDMVETATVARTIQLLLQCVQTHNRDLKRIEDTLRVVDVRVHDVRNVSTFVTPCPMCITKTAFQAQHPACM